MMKIAFIIDGRSPIAINWVGYFSRTMYDVHVFSTFPCSIESFPNASVTQLPIRANQFQLLKNKTTLTPKKSINRNPFSRLPGQSQGGRIYSLLKRLHQRITIFELNRATSFLRERLTHFQPDLVHAMRVPYEGILAAQSVNEKMPLLVSIWGNDFTLWAKNSVIIAHETRRTMRRADALHTDCYRDERLAISSWDFNPSRPSLVVPGSGGVKKEAFSPGDSTPSIRKKLGIPEGVQVVVNPRGYRLYVRNEVFLKAIPIVLNAFPNTIFLCVDLQANPAIIKMVEDLGIGNNMRLLPKVLQAQLGEFYRLSEIVVSPSVHDGTPNSLIEAMACGCFPIVGDIESIREWITDGENGLLIDPDDPTSVANSIKRGLCDEELRNKAAVINRKLISERADYPIVMKQVERFYESIVRS